MYIYMWVHIYTPTYIDIDIDIAVWLEALLDRHAASADEKNSRYTNAYLNLYICRYRYVCMPILRDQFGWKRY